MTSDEYPSSDAPYTIHVCGQRDDLSWGEGGGGGGGGGGGLQLGTIEHEDELHENDF